MNQQAPKPLLQQVAALTSIGIGMSFFFVGMIDVFTSKPSWSVVYLLVAGAGFMIIGVVLLLYYKKKQ